MTSTYPQTSRPKNVVSIISARVRRDEEVAAAWDRFVVAQQRSKQTLDQADGIAAGKAYADFVELFVRRA